MQLMPALPAAVWFSCAVAVSAAASSRGTHGAAVTPVQKVLEMLTGMLAKGKRERHNEQVQFAAYKQFCADTIAEKTGSVGALAEQIEILQASIQKATTDANTAGEKVRELNGDVATWSADDKAAARVRETERAEYLQAHKEYSDTIDAVTKASQVVQAQAYNRPQVSLLMGAEGAHELSEARRALLAFLAAARDGAEAAPEAYAYEYRSSGVLDMLQKLKDKFVDERTALEKEELQKRHAHEMLTQDLKKSITAAEAAVAEKVQQKARYLEASASQQADLGDATTTRKDDQEYLQKMTATCGQKEADYKECQKLRADELVAIEKAIEILSSDKVLGTSNAYFASMLQSPGSAAAFVQIHEADRSPAQRLVAAYLQKQGEKIHSQALSALALHAQEDPFGKVRKMIQDLITRLQEEAGEEVQHKAWCDQELAANEQARSSRTTEVERLSSQIDGLTSSLAQLAADLTDLAKKVADTEQQVVKETQLRADEKATNERTLSDAQEAQTAIGQAVTVLKEFYQQAAESASFVQDAAGQAQEPAFEASYKGMGAENGGVVAMLEVIQADYARLESTARAMEATAQQEFDRFKTESAVLKAQTETDIEHKKRSKQAQEQSLVDARNDLTSTQKELDAASKYHEQLRPSCLDSGMTFQERDQRRQEEIQSLQEALRILNGEDITTPAAAL